MIGGFNKVRLNELARKRIRETALTTPFLCFDSKVKPREAWKVRYLRVGFCRLRTENHNGEPTKCSYCLVSTPYNCVYKVTLQELFFNELFK